MNIALVFSDLENAEFPIERQFHVLKHFCKIDPDYRENIIEQSEYTEEEIDFQLKGRGSKFLPVFCKNPLDLFEIIKKKFEYQKIEAFWIAGRCEFQIEFSKTDFPNGIGEDRIIHLDQVPEVIKSAFSKRDYETLQQIVYETDPKLTWIVNVILQTVDHKPTIISIFPGTYAPPVPNREEQSEEQYNESVEFWSKHIIIS